jgi:hypothetical protein
MLFGLFDEAPTTIRRLGWAPCIIAEMPPYLEYLDNLLGGVNLLLSSLNGNPALGQEPAGSIRHAPTFSQLLPLLPSTPVLVPSVTSLNENCLAPSSDIRYPPARPRSALIGWTLGLRALGKIRLSKRSTVHPRKIYRHQDRAIGSTGESIVKVPRRRSAMLSNTIKPVSFVLSARPCIGYSI